MGSPEELATDQRLTALEHACRSAIGDRLRSVTIDSPECSTTVYRRGDLSPGVDEHTRNAAEGDCAVCADGGRIVTECEDRYVTHLQHGETHVVATSDGLKMDRGPELSAVVRGVLAE